jgi:leucyl-tRNA synthetase
MVTHETYQDENGKWLLPTEVIKNDKDQPVHIQTGKPVKIGGSIKMSKSKKNVIDPEEILETYGADAARLFILSDSPPERDLEWTVSGIEGAWRFVNRVYAAVIPLDLTAAPVDQYTDNAVSLRRITHKTIKGVADDIEAFAMNKAVAKLREFYNAFTAFTAKDPSEKYALAEAVRAFMIMINPIMPHLAEELWAIKKMGKGLLVEEPWPTYDEALLVADTVKIAVQVNGKLRAAITLPASADQKAAEVAALAEENVRRAIGEQTVRKVIVVQGKIVNVVVG